MDWPSRPDFWKWNFALSGSKAFGLRSALWKMFAGEIGLVVADFRQGRAIADF